MIIAEIGQNHCGDMALAKKLIELAKEYRADLVKFQLYDHNQLYKEHPEIPDVALSFDQAKMLFDYGTEIGIEVFFSVFDVERVKWCEEIGVKRYKIACGMSDIPTMEAIAKTGKPVIMSMNDDTDGGYHCGSTKAQVDYLYCVSKYPTQLSDLHFESGLFEDTGDTLGSSDGRGEYHREYDGLSDHSIGLDACKIALARGASIIEKHFAIDHKTGIDAKWSMTPDELKELVRFKNVVSEVL